MQFWTCFSIAFLFQRTCMSADEQFRVIADIQIIAYVQLISSTSSRTIINQIRAAG